MEGPRSSATGRSSCGSFRTRSPARAGAAIGCATGTVWGGLKRMGDLGGASIAVFCQGPAGLSATLRPSIPRRHRRRWRFAN